MNAPRAIARGEQLLVVCLCAAWCDTCNEFRAAIAGLARACGEIGFVWLDIEDDSALVGDVDIENFPTLAVFRGGTPLFYGVTLPLAPVVRRMLDSLRGPDSRPIGVPPQIEALPTALGERKREAPA